MIDKADKQEERNLYGAIFMFHMKLILPTNDVTNVCSCFFAQQMSIPMKLDTPRELATLTVAKS